jgi:hypothetical protein
MKRLLLVAVLAATALSLPATVALARGDGWVFFPSSSFTTDSCGTSVANDVLVNKEFAKAYVAPDGSFVVHLVTGSFKVRLTNLDTGTSFVVNASGTGHDAVFFPNGDFLFQSSGTSIVTITAAQAAATGLPEIFTNSGNMLLLFGADGSLQVLQRTGALVDLCARLTA